MSETKEYTPIDGIPVFPEGGSNYGHLVQWQAPGTFFPAGAICVMDIVKDPKSSQGWKPSKKKFNAAQLANGNYSRRVYVYRDEIHGILEAFNRLMQENMGETGPDVESPYQFEKGGKANRAVDTAIDGFSEFGGDTPSEGSDTSDPF